MAVVAAGAWEFASLRAGIGKGGRFPPESTGVALIVTVGSLAALALVGLVGAWFKRRAGRGARRLPYGITVSRRRR